MKLAQWRSAILEGPPHAESTHASGLGLVSPAAYDPYQPNQTGSEPAANNTLNATPTGSTPEAQLGLSTNNLQIVMDQPRPDELDTGINLIQGTRAYDP